MSIVLHCNLCEFEVEDVDNVLVELQHWLIIRNSHSAHGEEHFCRKCRLEQEDIINAQQDARLEYLEKHDDE